LKEEQQEASVLLGKLKYLLLAITLAGAYININKRTVKEYLSLLKNQKNKSIRLLREEIEDTSRSHTRQHPLATA